MENLDPPPPPIKDGKMARFCSSRAFILDLGGGGWGFAVPFYFVQDCRYQNPKKWPKKSIRKFSKKMFINPNFIKFINPNFIKFIPGIPIYPNFI